MDWKNIPQTSKANIRSICNAHDLPNSLDLMATTSYYVPSVIENTPRGERSFDLFSRLLRERIVFVGSEINDVVASIFVGQLLLLDSEDSSKDIFMYINSPGGSVTSGLAMYDTMQHVRADVVTICMGQCASMGAFLLSSGARNKRMALPHSRILIHQPLGGAQGQASDIAIQANEILRLKKMLNEILMHNCNLSRKEPWNYEDIEKATDRDKIMDPQEAKDFGLIDQVILKRPNTTEASSH
jgi:ATP-dependent Clp protease protease subunit